MNITTMTPDQIQAQLDKWEHEFRTAVERLDDTKCGASIATGWGGELIVCDISYGKVTTESVLDGTAKAESWQLTEDGRYAFVEVWHRGEQTGDSVYVECWDRNGRTFHGYVDPTTRAVVQTG